ncbi:MAG: bifunctional RNase H/acid phosphatase [Nocardioidaceae bacterium]|nr:bifunctional RNase H/acid phosphatase [Nocardioidaceae bacterium]
MPEESPRRLIIEADGGSRGNPGPAAYGALIRDADTNMVLAERAEAIGVATNNVAEYRGLIAGLELALEHAPNAELEVRMDSKLVIEQMAGRWKIKHPDMRPLAIQAQSLAPFGVEWTWVPREQNSAADTILNDVLDQAQGKPPRTRRTTASTVQAEAETAARAILDTPTTARNPLAGWRDPTVQTPTTLILLRHGVTDNTVAKLFCGSGGSDPGLNDEGHAQADRAAAYLRRAGGIDAIVASPLRRAQETAAVVAEQLALEVRTEDGLAETAFGAWDGLSLEQVDERFPHELEAWLASTGAAPPGGESYDTVFERAVAAKDELLRGFAGRTVVAVSHVTPIKMLVRLTLGAPMPVVHRLEVAPASLTTLRWWPDGVATLRSFSAIPE